VVSFDKISHDWMLAHIPTDKAILRKWLKAGFVYRDELFPTEAGAPQGGVISPVLANMTLDGLEAMLAEKFPKAKRTGLKMNMVRYADDFIITGHSKEWLEQEVIPVVVEFLATRGLVLSPEKTRITHIDEGFDFLGWNIRKYNGKLLRIKEKYFKTRGTRNWVFTATETQEDGTKREITLLQESGTPIQRHVKIRADANPHASGSLIGVSSYRPSP
jgi:hypothetical protein